MHDDDSIMKSFQRVLDDLDAARAELHSTGSLTEQPPPHVTVEPLWARDTAPPPNDLPTAPQRRGHWVGVCGAGAVGGLLVVSSVLANGPLGPGGQGGSGTSTRPDRPAHQDVQGSQGDGGAEREVPRRTYRIPQPHTGGWSHGHHAIEVRAVAARFQDPTAGPR
ncbi:hypothetical protein AB0J57_01275 [Streptomyces sp. NPDC049837]|uniref:hypothetical protein n=1 Tax=Streptomyces sp. NPDC049837 TaxID=3155277 RepID=UPI0034328486